MMSFNSIRRSKTVAICVWLTFGFMCAIALTACSGMSSIPAEQETLELSECSLTKQVGYDGVSLMVDESWDEEIKEGICTWTIDEERDVKLVLTTYTSYSFGQPELGRLCMHLEYPKSAFHQWHDWAPYADNEKIVFGTFKGTGEDESHQAMVDYFVASIEWRDDDYYVATGNSFLLELILPEKARVRDADDLLSDITDTIVWNPSETHLDSVMLGYTETRSPLDVRGA